MAECISIEELPTVGCCDSHCDPLIDTSGDESFAVTKRVDFVQDGGTSFRPYVDSPNMRAGVYYCTMSSGTGTRTVGQVFGNLLGMNPGGVSHEGLLFTAYPPFPGFPDQPTFEGTLDVAQCAYFRFNIIYGVGDPSELVTFTATRISPLP